MNKKSIKSEKGVTLSSLVVYIVVFVIIIGIMSTISNYFYKNVFQIKSSHKYVSEFNKFSMFFIDDVKKNSDIINITEDSLEFDDGTTYRYRDNCIYRNDVKIAKYFKSFTFTKSEYKVKSTNKNIINVNATLGNSEDYITRNIDFVLKYW